MSTFNPQTGSDWAQIVASIIAFFAACWATVTWPFKTFETKRAANAMYEIIDKSYVRKVENDGTRNYVHPTELVTVNEKLDKIITHLNIL